MPATVLRHPDPSVAKGACKSCGSNQADPLDSVRVGLEERSWSFHRQGMKAARALERGRFVPSPPLGPAMSEESARFLSLGAQGIDRGAGVLGVNGSATKPTPVSRARKGLNQGFAYLSGTNLFVVGPLGADLVPHLCKKPTWIGDYSDVFSDKDYGDGHRILHWKDMVYTHGCKLAKKVWCLSIWGYKDVGNLGFAWLNDPPNKWPSRVLRQLIAMCQEKNSYERADGEDFAVCSHLEIDNIDFETCNFDDWCSRYFCDPDVSCTCWNCNLGNDLCMNAGGPFNHCVEMVLRYNIEADPPRCQGNIICNYGVLMAPEKPKC